MATPAMASRLVERYRLRPAKVAVEEVEPYPRFADGVDVDATGLYRPGAEAGLTVVHAPHDDAGGQGARPCTVAGVSVGPAAEGSLNGAPPPGARFTLVSKVGKLAKLRTSAVPGWLLGSCERWSVAEGPEPAGAASRARRRQHIGRGCPVRCAGAGWSHAFHCGDRAARGAVGPEPREGPGVSPGGLPELCPSCCPVSAGRLTCLRSKRQRSRPSCPRRPGSTTFRLYRRSRRRDWSHQQPLLQPDVWPDQAGHSGEPVCRCRRHDRPSQRPVRPLGSARSQAWGITTGSAGDLVAVLDTGVDPNQPQLKGKVIIGPDVCADDRPSVAPRRTTRTGTARS